MKKKILFYNGSLRMGGIERVMTEVLQNLNLEKYEIDLLIMDELKKENVFKDEIPQKIKIDYLVSENTLRKTMLYREDRKNSFFSKLMYMYMMEVEKLEKKRNLKKISEKNYDVIIDYDMGLSKDIDMIKGNKKIAWVHASIKNWYEKDSRIKRLGERLKKYDQIVTICDEMKKETEELYPFLRGKIVRIYNPFNIQRIKKMSENRENITPEQRKLMEDNYIITVMRLTTHQKDFETLIKGMKEFYKITNSELKLYILGEGPDREKIEKNIKKEKLQEKIKLLGSIKNPYPWIKNSEFMVHSSKYEGFGLVLVEGMILGKAVIASKCPVGPEEVLNGGKNGILYPVGDYKELAKRILELYHNIEIRKNYEIKSLERVKSFDRKEIIKEYEKLIEESQDGQNKNR